MPTISSFYGILIQMFWKDHAPQLFNEVRLELGAVTWPGDLDLAPDAMYEEIKKQGLWKIG